jgi:hypothetical protein
VADGWRCVLGDHMETLGRGGVAVFDGMRREVSMREVEEVFRNAVWLPIALTCRICHDAQYRDA